MYNVVVFKKVAGEMMGVMIGIGRAFLQLVYQLFKLLPVQDKIVMISRQGNTPSVDFILLRDELEREAPSVKVLFLCRTLDGGVDSTFLSKLGYLFHMFRQMYHLATSKAAVLDTYCIVVSLLKHRKSLKVIQMWHSMGTMKLFGYTAVGSKEGSSAKIAESMHMHENYSWFIAASENYREHLARGFRCDAGKAFISPLPRYDLLRDRIYKEKKRQEILSAYPELRDRKIILYCPTFRKNESQMQKALEGLAAYLPEGCCLVAKLHPLSKITVDSADVYRAEGFSTFDMLFAADCVISDYSCVVYEAGVLGLPLYFYTFDMEEYTEDRGFALDYEGEMPGVISGDPQVIMQAVSEGRSDPEAVRAFTDRYVEPTDCATVKIARFVLSEGNIRTGEDRH